MTVLGVLAAAGLAIVVAVLVFACVLERCVEAYGRIGGPPWERRS